MVGDGVFAREIGEVYDDRLQQAIICYGATLLGVVEWACTFCTGGVDGGDGGGVRLLVAALYHEFSAVQFTIFSFDGGMYVDCDAIFLLRSNR